MVTTLVVKPPPCHHLYWHLRCEVCELSLSSNTNVWCGKQTDTVVHSCLQPVCTGCAVCRYTMSQTTPKHGNDMANSRCSDGSFWHARPFVRATMVTKKQMLPGRNCQFRWASGGFRWELTRYVVSILHRLFTNTGILKKLSLFERWTDPKHFSKQALQIQRITQYLKKSRPWVYGLLILCSWTSKHFLFWLWVWLFRIIIL